MAVARAALATQLVNSQNLDLKLSLTLGVVAIALVRSLPRRLACQMWERKVTALKFDEDIHWNTLEGINHIPEARGKVIAYQHRHVEL